MKYHIEYIRKDIPEFSIPPYKGTRYEDLVPDTLDIQERITLAVNGLTGPTDPDKDHLLYCTVNFRSNPPSMWHSSADLCQVKFEEALPLMRVASGSNLNDHIDPVWMANALREIGPDGLFYWPCFPWARGAGGGDLLPSGLAATTPVKYSCPPSMCGRRIGAMTAYLLRDPSGPWNPEIQKMVNGLWGVAIRKEDYAYFPQGGFLPNVPRVKDAALPVGIGSSYVGWTIHGLAQYHRVTKYEPAMELAEKLARYLVRHGRWYGSDGEFLPNYAGEDGGRVPGRDGVQGFDPGPVAPKGHVHMQHHMVPLLGLLDHALAVGDRERAQFVRRCFEWAKTKGNTLVGFFPENIGWVDQQLTSELCGVAGMIGLALKLSAAGLGDYWDDADRWIRNQFAEGQLLQADWIYRCHMGGLVNTRGGPGPVDAIPPSAFDPLVQSIDRVPERNIGAFAGWPTANDWYIGDGSGIMHCCTGNATRALYYIWEHILSHDQGTVSVNLLLNRPSPWVDVHSHVPYVGQVDIRVKQPCRLRVRIPEWTRQQDVRCTINGGNASLSWDGRYALVGALRPGDEVRIIFPIAERRVETDIEKQHYFLIIRGNEVVNIDPPGRFCPLYLRNHYRDGNTRWKKVRRFVSEESLLW